MIIDCISDLHGHYPKLEGGDLLIIAGDLTARDFEADMASFDYWLNEQPYKKKVVISGNHDNVLQEERLKLMFCDYLCDSGTEFEGFKIWGSPWVKSFPGMNPKAKAFTVHTEEELAEKWALIPDDVDILVTHSPPNGMRDEFDEVTKWGTKQFNGGSLSLQKRIMNIVRPKKRLLVCGHIHESYGILNVSSAQYDLCTWKIINASHVNECYQPVNRPIRIIL